MAKLAEAVEATAIRPFQAAKVPDAELTDLRRRCLLYTSDAADEL